MTYIRGGTGVVQAGSQRGWTTVTCLGTH